MDLNIIWFILVTVLFIGFFFLEGFDYGVGILLPFLGKDDKSRRVIINTIGPHWDGNEVWLLTAGGAIFAAFPHWYATMFSGFYLALFLMLVALIVRAMSFEFRSKDESPIWRKTWDWIIFFGSVVPALLWGVALANLVKGVPIDETMTYTGGFFNLLNPYAIVGGLTTLTLFTLHGAIFLTLKTTDDILESARDISKKLWFPTTIILLLFVVYSYFETELFAGLGINPGTAPMVALVALISVRYLLNTKREGWAFIMTSVTIVFATITIFSGLFPNVMVSSTNPEFNLTIYNASSSPYTLEVMTIVALVFVPLVLLYQGWTYWVFRKRISRNSELEY
jgi:cytochrome d ubiquinol oxidase subunit II